MGAWDTIKNSVAQNTGNIEKAIVEVIDVRGRSMNMLADSVDIRGSAAGAASVRGLGSGASTQTFMNKGLMSDAIKDMAGVSANMVSDEQVESISGAKNKFFTVQFNPSSLQLTGYSGGLIQKIDFSSKKRSADYVPGNTTISMSVSLLFDSCDAQDAFMSDKINLSPTAVGTGIAKAALSAAGKKKTSVQSEVEGFIAALRNRFTRLVTFHWGEFNYSGILRNVSASYTMFNVLGEPVRATVDLSMMCADRELAPNSLAVWQERYKKAFEKGSKSFTQTTQKFGNLLNL